MLAPLVVVRVPDLVEAEQQGGGERGGLGAARGALVVFRDAPQAEVVVLHGGGGRGALELRHLEAAEGEHGLHEGRVVEGHYGEGVWEGKGVSMVRLEVW